MKEEMKKAILLLTVSWSLVFLKTWQNNHYFFITGYHLGQLQEEKENLLQQIHTLTLEIAQLLSDKRIEKVATQELGMTYSTREPDPSFLFLEEETP